MNKFLVVGLGNPGEKYNFTRHNAGFMFIDKINSENFSQFEKSLVSTKNVFNVQITFMKPMTYMNLSGEAVLCYINYYKVPIENILVVFDDISLPIGKMRIRAKGSCGGHNGMRSVIDCLQTDKIKRIKVGVGDTPPNWDLDDWVMSKFTPEEVNELDKVFENCIKSTKLIVQNDILSAMNLFN